MGGEGSVDLGVVEGRYELMNTHIVFSSQRTNFKNNQKIYKLKIIPGWW